MTRFTVQNVFAVLATVGLTVFIFFMIFDKSLQSSGNIAIITIIIAAIAIYLTILASFFTQQVHNFFAECNKFFNNTLPSSLKRVIGVIRLLVRPLLIVLFIASLAGNVILINHFWHSFFPEHEISTPCAGKDICVTMINGQPIGISDGQQEFVDSRIHQHTFMLSQNTSNAEQAINAENKTISTDPSKYVTAVVVTTISSGNEQEEGNEELQGASTLQQEVNSGACTLPKCRKLRIDVANGGVDNQYASIVAQQIIMLAKRQPLLGVLGLSRSTTGTIAAIHILSDNHILMISSAASSDALTAISPYFLRVVPPDSQQGIVAADYASSLIKNAVVFYADNNPYSVTLATGFGNELQKMGKTVFYKAYQRNSDKGQEYDQIAEEWRSVLHQTKNPDPDFIFCACYSEDLNALLNALRNPQSRLSTLPVMGGDAAYDLGGYTPGNYHDLKFTAFSYPDEWGLMDVSKTCKNNTLVDAQNFSCDFANDFDPLRKNMGAYDYTRASANAITAYDAARVLLLAYKAVNDQISSDIPNMYTIQQSLLGNYGCTEFQGISGRIAFGRDGNPINKAVVILSADASGKTHILSGTKQLLASSTACDSFS